jgi:hypothetical protein
MSSFKGWRFFLVAPMACLVLGHAQAATLLNPQGEILVNRGGGFQPIEGKFELLPGDTLIANPGGSGLLSYGPGCAIPIDVGTVVAVQEPPPCDVTAQPDGTVAGAEGAPVEGAVEGVAAESAGLLNTGTLIAGGVVVGGGVALALALSGGSSGSSGSPDKPASP